MAAIFWTVVCVALGFIDHGSHPCTSASDGSGHINSERQYYDQVVYPTPAPREYAIGR